jgi:hypothetical protein
MSQPAPTNAPLIAGDASTIITSPEWMGWFAQLPGLDYGQVALANDITAAANIAELSIINTVVGKQGIYLIGGKIVAQVTAGALMAVSGWIKTGSSVYASAGYRQLASANNGASGPIATLPLIPFVITLNAGDTIHMGGAVSGSAGNRVISGISGGAIATFFNYVRIG